MTANVIEAMLLRWNEGPAGRTVTFLLPEDPGSHPFKGLKAGPSHGQRLALSIALIADDETTHDMPTQAPARPADGGNGKGAERAKGGWRARQAGIVCNEGAFKRFLVEQHGASLINGTMTDEQASEFVRVYCDVFSRADLDHDEYAATQWDALYSGYVVWRDDP